MIDGENFACHDEKSVTISHSPAAPRAAAAAAAAITSGSNGILLHVHRDVTSYWVVLGITGAKEAKSVLQIQEYSHMCDGRQRVY